MSKTECDATAAKILKPDAAWRSELTVEQLHVPRQHGTEHPGTSPLHREKRKGASACASYGADLLASDARFESRTAWPSSDKPATARDVSEHEHPSLFMWPIDVRCAGGDGRLGHVFPDRPRDTTGQRYWIYGATLRFKPDDG